MIYKWVKAAPRTGVGEAPGVRETPIPLSIESKITPE